MPTNPQNIRKITSKIYQNKIISSDEDKILKAEEKNKLYTK